MCICAHANHTWLLSGGSAQLKMITWVFPLKLYLLPFSSLKLKLTTMAKSIPKQWASWSKWPCFLYDLPLFFFFCLPADSPFSIKHEQLVFSLCSPCSFSCHTLLECKCLLLFGQNCQPLSPTATLSVSVLSLYAMLLLPFGDKLFVNSPKDKQSWTAAFLYIDSV